MILNKRNYKEKSFLQFYSFNDQILNFFKNKLLKNTGIFINASAFLENIKYEKITLEKIENEFVDKRFNKNREF